MISNSWFFNHLVCPDCRTDLQVRGSVVCSKCGYSRPTESIDYKPDLSNSLTIELPRPVSFDPTVTLNKLNLETPDLTYDGPEAIRDSRELMSEIQKYLNPGDKVLDLGCGPKDQAVPIAHLAYQYVGVDYSNPNADLLVDAHTIPFSDNTFDCVLSYAVLEHLHSPIIALNEIRRVLKPGGVYVGTVSQGEPFHDSYFHHTAWGIISLINSIPELSLIRMWPSYDTLAALASMSRYPKIIRKFITLIDKVHRSLPILAPRKLKWTDAEKKLDQLHRAGSICFVVQKL